MLRLAAMSITAATGGSVENYSVPLKRVDVAFYQGFGQCLCGFEIGVFADLHPGLLRIAYLGDKDQLRLVEATGHLGRPPQSALRFLI